MMLTLEELKARLIDEFDEVTLLELLGIDGTMLVERFTDHVEDRYEELLEQLEEEIDEEE